MIQVCLNFHHFDSYLLYKDGIRKTYTVHRLVAITFLENLFKYGYINHKDENKLNNNLDNLEWCTFNYNINYGTKQERRSKQGRPIVQLDSNGTIINTYYNATYAGKILKFNCWGIYDCCNGKRKKAFGYIWKYAKDFK